MRADGFTGWSRPATLTLVVGLVLAAAVLAPWKLKFSVDARELYDELEGDPEQLIAAAFIYQETRLANDSRERLMLGLSAALGVVTVVQTLLWMLALGLD